MMNITFLKRLSAVVSITLLALPALAQERQQPLTGSRWDISLDLPVWPSLGDLQPLAGGSFDSNGYGLGVSWHFPVAQFANSELLLGGDLTFAATDSNIPAIFGDMLARQMYLGASAKWLFGDSRNISLDAGVGYHEVDVALVDSGRWGTLEHEYWGKEKASMFVGATWDIGAARPHKNSGFFVGLRVHFADFGQVYDAQFTGPALGPNAGNLDGPLYLIRIGYSGR